MNFKLPSSNDGKSTLKRPRAIDVEPRSPRAATVDSYTPRTRQKYILSKACTEAMGCPYFLKRWDKFKECANAQASEKSAPSGEYDLLTDWMVDEWKQVIDTVLVGRAADENIDDPKQLQKNFAQEHINAIESLSYCLDEAAKETLAQALERFYLCNIGPAPFSIHALENEEKISDKITVTVAEHCLQMATHWLRHPPSFMTALELEELVVLTLFHDVYYYDDFPHHDARTLELFDKYLRFPIPKQIVGDHLTYSPVAHDQLISFSFDSDIETLQQEWVQMDWYLTMVNLKQKADVSKRQGDGVTLPLEFFHHALGRFLTHDSVIPVASI